MSSLHAASLFAAARDEGPDAKTREAMWDRVALESGLAVGATTAASAAGAKAAAASATSGVSIAASKLIAIGAAIGAVSAVIGVVTTLAVIEPEGPAGGGAPSAATARVVHTPRAGARLAEPEPRPRDPVQVNRPAASPSAPPSAVTRNADGDLAAEARLVTDARTSLVGGDAIRALALVRTARRLASHALEPEELSLEARALRALGRADEAAAIDLTLKNRYPGHALAR